MFSARFVLKHGSPSERDYNAVCWSRRKCFAVLEATRSFFLLRTQWILPGGRNGWRRRTLPGTRLHATWRLPNVGVNRTAGTIMQNSSEAPLENALWGATWQFFFCTCQVAERRTRLNCWNKVSMDHGANDKNSKAGRMRKIFISLARFREHVDQPSPRDLDDRRSRIAMLSGNRYCYVVLLDVTSWL